jgi:hypothetical protein
MSKWFVANGLSLNTDKTDVKTVNLNYFQDDPYKALYTGKKNK